MCTSDEGFSLLELLVALTISLLLALAVCPLWVSLQAAGSAAADQVVIGGQTRVAAARLERDLRLAAPDPAGLGVRGAVLRADEREVVLLVAREEGSLELIEWEVVGSALMRRRGPWTSRDVAGLNHTWFTDHKTMLEGLTGDARFAYVVLGAMRDAVVTPEDRAGVEAVTLHGSVRAATGRQGGRVDLRVWGRLGR